MAYSRYKANYFFSIYKIYIFYSYIDSVYMNLQQLHYIVAVDTYRHVITAADKCHVTQA